VFFILAFLRRKTEGAERAAPVSSVHAGRSEPGAASREADVAASRELDAVDRAMHRHAEGDAAAFAEVFTALAPRLQLFLRRLGCTRDIADDLTQETFLRMHHARGSFARGKPVAPWAYAIARNCFISHVRSGRSKLARASVDADRVELGLAATSSAEEESMARQSAEIVQRTLAGMTPARREAFILLRYEGLSVAAAAEVVGVSEAALKIRAFHAYELLRAALAGMAAEAPTDAAGNRLATET
jgi:RNA polymerase sigma-70 factor, ECF subfamily